MCKFCDDLKWRQYSVAYRSSFADDNFCELVSPVLYTNEDGDLEVIGSDCENCNGCAQTDIFTLTACDTRIGLQFQRDANDAHIGQFSEMFHINFCPFCGKWISEEIIPFEKIRHISVKEE